MGRWFLALYVCAAACAHAPSGVPRVEHPPHTAKLEPLEVRLNPKFVMAGGAVWVTCIVPEQYPQGILRLALEDVFASEMPIERIQTRRLAERLPCGRYIASCTVRTRLGTERVEQILNVLGECHE